MNKKTKLLALAGVTLVSAATLAACGGSQSKDGGESTTYTYVYASDPSSLDYTVVNKNTTGEVVGNLVDGLLENDPYGNYVPSLAEDWKVSEDGLTYTYTLRDDAKWFTADGDEYADIVAEDFVTGMKHAADAKSEALYLVQDSIVGLAEYVNGETDDFSTVGVKAVDEKTVQYTLKKPESYWNSKMTMGITFPINAEFLASKGEDFGAPNADSILYSGPYLLSALTAKSSIEYTKNPNYWDADNVNIENIKLTYYDGSDPESLVNNFTDGVYTGARIYPTTPSYKSVKEKFGDNIVYTPQDGTSYYGVFNLNRSAYEHTAKTTDAQKESTKKAIMNKDFRQAVNFAFDRTGYAAQDVGEDAADKTLRNTLTPETFVSVGEETFGAVAQKELAAYGDEWKDVNLADGQNGLYNPEKAKAEFEKAKAALEAEGVEFPIHIDVPVYQSSDIFVQKAASMKQSIEETLGTDNIVLDLHQLDEDTFYNITFYAETPAQNDYDLSTAAGWGPDYQDPSTYLDIFNPSNGATVHQIGIAPGENQDVAQAVGLDKYEELTQAAAAENSDLKKRYEMYAKAEAWLVDSSLLLMTTSKGATPTVTKAVPFTVGYGWSGIKSSPSSFKYMKLQSDAVVAKDYEAALEKWKEEKAKSNAEAQEDFANHVE
ncbi:peptide ABC transporter substrate-binding protein [Streptococcus zalophi]|uniref:Peptide ABC transporter substrate-binding protein n=1 Tax=Streptococcus zalophi TaxID=640031 RepID=A0A934UDM0_9STRE|nr:peptide ABC transporter substrate-binding protein [Streptococcus zalophi]MBJ8349818.1 peptide ABC transporter substrate-binding protein [Streptococcus zalophi]MCR8967587.1 peptide ABC transporter substrate-binding protein [Streptococcus zalophi]